MSDPTERLMMIVYGDGGRLHLPGLTDSKTECGQDTDDLRREERPVHWAGVWCTDCVRVGRARHYSSF